MDNWNSYYSNLEPSAVSVKKNLQRLKTLHFFEFVDLSNLVLDLFSGQCDTNKGLRGYGYRLINGDYSHELLTINQSEAEKVQLNSVELPFKEGLFDAVIVQGGLHHLESLQQMIQCLKEIKRVLKPNGRVFISEPANTVIVSAWLFLIKKTTLWKLTPYSRNWHHLYMAEEKTHKHYLTICDELYSYLKEDWCVELHKVGLITEFFRIRKEC